MLAFCVVLEVKGIGDEDGTSDLGVKLFCLACQSARLERLGRLPFCQHVLQIVRSLMPLYRPRLNSMY